MRAWYADQDAPTPPGCEGWPAVCEVSVLLRTGMVPLAEVPADVWQAVRAARGAAAQARAEHVARVAALLGGDKAVARAKADATTPTGPT